MLCDELLAKRNLPEVWDGNSADWASRREGIKEILQREVYGFRPGEPEELTFAEQPEGPFSGHFFAGKASLRKTEIRGKLNGREFFFPVYAVIPKGKKNLPFFVHMNFRPDMPDGLMPTEEIIDNGFALFAFGYGDVTADDGDFSSGLAGTVFGGRERAGSDCGKIALWSWAASRVMDYCETLDCLDFTRSAVLGHSRLGKAALFTGLMDERFRFVLSNESGCAGAALNRGKAGETVGRIGSVFPYWFAPEYRKYDGREEEMPFDQHFLLAGCAPRYVYVASAVEDTWSDPDSEYLSCCAAGKVYERLGLPGFVHPDRLPEPGDVFREGSVGYHLRGGTHALSREDWQRCFEFIRACSAKTTPAGSRPAATSTGSCPGF